ncbi:MAG TPA: GH92 family glycosyl hydrolase [Candidatus Acidoferrales bacterium]|nr:GH92 family glycosyl hydrolase [Candidatus Acidoferrales bacterium]
MTSRLIAAALSVAFSLQTGLIAAEDYTQLVDVFIGTGGHGHTYPGPSMPFGMIQPGPDTRNDNSWDSCAGYHLSDTSILGFSHTHLSGVGVPDYGDILLMPVTGPVRLNPGDPKVPGSGYRSAFRHETEKAQPGYYSVFLDDYQVQVELTASDRVAFHRYTFAHPGPAAFLVDLIHRDPVTEGFIHVVSDRRIEGLRRSKFWAGDQYHYFAMEFSKAFVAHKIYNRGTEAEGTRAEGKALQSVLSFNVEEGERIEVKVATSAVGAEGAWRNLEAEAKDVNFDQARKHSHQAWSDYLSRIQLAGGSPSEQRIFYTALYHTLLAPNLYQDVDRQYRGMDGQVHTAIGFTNYTVFSLWDTFRALHPLLTIIDPPREADIAKTLVNMGKLYGEIPMWELAANDTRCMIGYHGVSVIADAYAKGITNLDAEEAFTQMKRTAMLDKRGLKDYRTFGYVPANKGSQAVSKTLEYAYDDWCIAQMAKALRKQEDYEYFTARSQFYRNIYDPSVGFMRGKDDAHAWSQPFDPQAPGLNYTEGNAYQYSLFAPQDVPGLIQLLGGKARLAAYLDTLFTKPMTLDLGEEDDISGLIGQYAHGNEPSHHLAYFYCFAGEPWKTQAMIRRILKEQYSDTPAGLNGNDDCGQISAWYVLSALGFYAVCPGQSGYVIGSPLFQRATLRLTQGKTFTIEAENNSPQNVYIQTARLNGKPLDEYMLYHSSIINGGVLAFSMGDRARTNWAATDPAGFDAQPRVSAIPYLTRVSDKFLDVCRIEMKCDDPLAEIRYTLDGARPGPDSAKFTTPFDISNTVTIKMRSYTRGCPPSIVTTRTLARSEALRLATPPAPGLKYSYYEGIYRSVYDFAHDQPAATGLVDLPTTSVCQRSNWVATTFEGLIKIPRDGEYTFYVAAKDGGQLLIDREEQFESDGRKDVALPQQSTIALREGFHRFTLKTYKCTETISLTVEWSGPDFPRTPMPSNVFYHTTD